MPNINITSIILGKTTLNIGDKVIFEVCMTNTGDLGDIDLYTGFGYQDDPRYPITFIGDGRGQGYIEQIIGSVLPGESLCPYGEVTVTKEVSDAQVIGKDIRFFAAAIPGNTLSKDVTIVIGQTGSLECITDPPGALIILDDVSTGKYTPSTFKLTTGWHKRKYILSGYYTIEGYVWIDANVTTKDNVRFQKIVEKCDTYVKVIDEAGNPLSGLTVFIVEYGYFTTKADGLAGSLTLEKGKTYNIEIFQPAGPTLWKGTMVACDKVPFVISITIPIPPELKQIGEITYSIIKQIGKDEIEFYIPITNTSDKTNCYYVDLYNQVKHLEREPFGLNYITLKPGKSTTLKMTSVGAVFPMWSIEDVQDQIIKFQLRSVEAGLLDICPLTGYEIVDEVELDMTNINAVITAYIDNTKGLVTKDLKIGLLYVDPLGVFKKDVCGSPVNLADVTNTIISTQWTNPGPFTCDNIAYSIGSNFILYAEGYDKDDNKYVVKSDMFKSIYGKKEVTIIITGLPEEPCMFKNPLDPTQCLLTGEQAKWIKWGIIGVAGLYVLSITAPLIRGTGAAIERVVKK